MRRLLPAATGAIRNKARGSARYYHCRKDSGGCGGSWVKADNLERFLVGMVVAVADSSDAIGMIQAEVGVRSDELSALVLEHADTHTKLSAAGGKRANNTISAEGYDPATARRSRTP